MGVKMAISVRMPEMGEGVTEGTISRWLKAVGDVVQQYEPILEIETDKVTTEATAESAGTLLQIYVQEGETVPVGTLLAQIGEAGEQISESDDVQPDEVKGKPKLVGVTAPSRSGNGMPAVVKPYTGRISPVVGRIASEHNVDLNQVKGTGRDNRITKKDILAYVAARQSAPAAAPAKPLPPVVPAASPPVPPAPLLSPAPTPVAGETVPLTSMRRSIAEHMVRSKHTSPHVTTVFEFDFTTVAAHRAAYKAQFARDGANLTYTAYLVAAAVKALKAHPMVNSSWSDQGIVLKQQINIGMAVALEEGLIVPVIKQADSMNLLGLARAINDLSARARVGQLRPTEVQDGTFTITNHGMSGSLFATPIINQPQCGILGVGMIEKRVKVINDAIAIRPQAYVSLTFDHRILDGASADNFVSSLKDNIENW
jgi:2-oxoisovalerate dehydrogenase E2 component (dihydrolipoyl transacylase)